jgi:hypothetical protein
VIVYNLYNGLIGGKNMSEINLGEKDKQLYQMFCELGIFDLGDQIKFMEEMQEKNPQELEGLLKELAEKGTNRENNTTDGVEVGE